MKYKTITTTQTAIKEYSKATHNAALLNAVSVLRSGIGIPLNRTLN